jgi:type I restriction enzyme S subunit
MNGKQLKNSILQWAIQGKLVPQDPNDEPASVLLEKIRQEKERLIKEKKIKRDKNASIIYRGEDNSYYEKMLATGEVKCIDEEIPFDVPNGWEWTRIGNIFNHTSGKQQSSSNKGGGTPQKFITTSNLYWGHFVLDNVKVMNFTDEEIKTCSATKGDLLVCEGGAGYGRSAIWNEDYDICLQNHVHRLRPCVSGICEYVYYFIYLLKESNNLASVGTAMPGLSANRLKGLLLPFPSLTEQKRIVLKLEGLLPQIDKYSKVQNQLDELNTTIKESLKKSILQEAIQGKLVPQIAEEGTAQELLEQIKAEKQNLVKEGKLKKSALNDSIIFRGDDNRYYEKIGKKCVDITEEIPFEIPASWAWCHLNDIAESDLGKTMNKGQNSGELVPYLCSINVYWNKIDLSKIKQAQFTEIELAKYLLQKNDLLICEGGDIGRAAIWDINETIYYQNALHRVRFYGKIFPKFFLYILSLYKALGLLDKKSKGMTIKHFTKSALNCIVIPLPPLLEQKRIIEKIEQLMQLLK